MFYRQRDIIEYSVELNDGRMLPVFGLIISDDSTYRYYGNKVNIFRVSKDMNAFNPAYHRILKESELDHSLETLSYVTTGIERLDPDSNRNIRVINRMSQKEFENTLAWATTLIGHKFLWLANPV